MKHPAKIVIERIAKGVACLGYPVRPAGLRGAGQTMQRLVARAHQLAEPPPGGRDATARLGAYVPQWWRGWKQGSRSARGAGEAGQF